MEGREANEPDLAVTSGSGFGYSEARRVTWRSSKPVRDIPWNPKLVKKRDPDSGLLYPP